ncbi:MAG: VCBS repeat-containing protein [Pyrinomonadaceae bacterium]
MRKNLALVALTALLLPALVMPGQAQRSGRNRTAPRPESERAERGEAGEGEDADVPSFFRGEINKKDYMDRRSEQIALRRGMYDDPTGKMRARAIRMMERQEQDLRRLQSESPDVPLIDSSRAWTPLGPDPIPNGSGQGGVGNPTSGRTISIAVDPSDANKAYIGTAQGGLYRTLDGGQTWTQLMDTGLTLAIGSLFFVPTSPPTLWVGTGEGGFSADSFFGYGVYRITDPGSDAPVLAGPFNKNGAAADVMTGRSAAALAVDPNDPNILYVGTSSAIGGIGGDVFGTAPTRGLFKSTNAMSANPTFTKLTIGAIGAGDQRVQDLVYEPGSSTNLLVGTAVTAGTNGGVWRTTDANVAAPTFTQTLSITSFALNTLVRPELAIHKVGGTTTVYIASSEDSGAATCGTGGTLRKSTDGGVTWSAPLPSGNGFCAGQCFYDIALAVNPNNANDVLLGGNVIGACTKAIAKSTDGGTLFVERGIGVHADNQVAKFAPSNPLIVYEGNDGGIYKSTDGGITYASFNNKGFQATQFQSIALHPSDRHFMLGGTQDNGTEWLQPNRNWTNADGGDGGFALIDQSAVDTENVNMYHTYFNQQNNVVGFARMTKASCIPTKDWVFRGACGAGGNDPTPSCDGSQEVLANGMVCNEAVEFYAPMALGPGTPNTVYYGTNRLYRSTNRGDTMPAVSQNLGSTLTAIGISRQNDNIRLVGTRAGTVFLTTTGSSTLTNVTGAISPTRYIARTAIDPNSATTAYVTLAGFGTPATPVQHVWKTTNLAEPTTTWVAASNGLPDDPVNAFVIDPANSNNLYAGTDIGIYRSTDAGANWAPFGIGFPRVAAFDMAIQNNNRILRVATHGRGIWEIALRPVAAKVADFNGDGRSDISVQRPNDSWYVINSTLSITDPPAPAPPVAFEGVSGDQLVPGDYDGDGKTDFAVFRSTDNSWRIRFSGGGDSNTVFGSSGDKPMQSDYDGDGKTDIAVYRPNSPVSGQATFFVKQSSDGSLFTVQWGLTTDKAVAGDYDGDNKADFAVWRPGSAVWYVLKSSCAYACFDGAQWGLDGDKLVPADYDGDGKFDRAVYRPSNGTWYVLKSGDGAVRSVQWGNSTDTPVPGDYDGDGMTDFAVWRGSTGDWFVLKSSNQPVRGFHWGATGDTPPAAKYIPEQATP